MPYGTAGYITMVRQNSGISAPNTTDLAQTSSPGASIKALSESFTTTLDRFQTVNIHNALYEPDDSAGLEQNEGDIVFPVHPESIGHFLKSCFNNVTVASITSTLAKSTFTSVTTDNYSDAAGTPYTLEVYRDQSGVSTSRYTGMIVNQLAFSVAVNQALQATANMVGFGHSLVTRATPVFPSSPTGYFDFTTCSLAINGTGNNFVEAFTITIQNNLEKVGSIKNNANIARIQRTDSQMIRINGTIHFNDYTEFSVFVGQTEQPMTLSFTKADSFSMIFTLPRVVYTAYPINISGRGRILANFDGIARYHTGSGTAIQIDLTTVNSNW